MFVTGGHGTVAPAEQTEMTFEEISAGIEAAHQRGCSCAGTSPTAPRCTWPSTPASTWSTTVTAWTRRAIARMVDRGTFLVPSQLFPARFADLMAGGGLGFTAAMAEDIERALAILPGANAAGVSCSSGTTTGPLGCPTAATPTSSSSTSRRRASPPLDVIRWATRNGFELMGRGHELGSVREGYLADLVVVDGDPLSDIGVLQDPARLLAVMKGGTLVKDELATVEAAA